MPDREGDGSGMEPLAAGDPRQVGAYRIHARLGAGGMGQVFLGFSPAGRAVAVKIVHPELARDPEFVRRFRHEVRAAEAVSGAYTAPVVAAGPGDSPPWLATVFVPGPSLAEVIGEAGPLPEAALWRLAGGLIEALEAVHARGLVHRDLKPANVLIAVDGPRVIDFGIARALDGAAMTASMMVAGTPAFMSPEQAQGLPAGPAADVFALGGVLAFAATGSPPFGSGAPAATLYRVVHAQPDLSAVPSSLRNLVASCLAKTPADRPPLGSLLRTVAAAAASYPGVSAGDFWPEPVAGLVSSRLGSFRAQLSGGSALPGQLPAPVPYQLTAPAAAGRYRAEDTRTSRRNHTGRPSSPGTGDASGTARSWSRRAMTAAAAVVMAAAGVAAGIAIFAASHGSSPQPPRAAGTRAAGTPAHASASLSRGGSASGSVSPGAAAPTLSVTVCTQPAVSCTASGEGADMKASPPQISTSVDGAEYVTHLTWQGWGDATATGTGVLEVNDCTPDCVSGTFTGYPATVSLSGLSTYASGQAAYAIMTVNAPAAPGTMPGFSSGLVP